jgi:membrane protein required for colicin V production
MNWQAFNWIDWMLVGVALVSVGIGITRGFIREVLSLVVWILATFNAYLLGDELSTMLTDLINKPSVRLSIAMAVLFVMTLLVGALLNHVFSEMVKNSGLTSADRILGIFFGLARGVILIMMLVLFTPAYMKQAKSWQQSRMLPQFQAWEAASRESVQSMGAYIHRTLT